MREAVPPVCKRVMSLGSIFQALSAMKTAASLEPPRRLMPITLPRSCCGSFISGREISCIGIETHTHTRYGQRIARLDVTLGSERLRLVLYGYRDDQVDALMRTFATEFPVVWQADIPKIEAARAAPV